MADIETLGILDEIQALVSDKLQVVSYKWLSRNFLVPSNTAKKLLQEFVEKKGCQLEVVYSLSGFLKNNPSAYHIKLVLGSKLSEAKEEFGDSCSVQVYSVQASIPKDPSVLWNAEFIQAEELFKEAPNVVNCLRDNRFCGVSNSFVKRTAEGSQGTPKSNTTSPPKTTGISEPFRPNSSNQTSNKKVEQSNPKPDVQSKPVPQNKKKAQNDNKTTSGNSGSLASMWGRASAKPKPESTVLPISNDAQVRANESVEDDSCDEDDDQDMNFKRGSNGEGNNRKRRVVFDYSDEEDDDEKDAVSLASPDPPKKKVSVDLKKSLEKKNLDFDELKEEKVKGSAIDSKKEENQDRKMGKITSDVDQKDKVGDSAQNAPKKRKVLKTCIDERGREVSEVVWEDDEKETKPDDNTKKEKADTNTANNVVNNPPAPAPKKTTPTVSNTTSKAGNKKAAAKDPKQGNIMSFFKKK